MPNMVLQNSKLTPRSSVRRYGMQNRNTTRLLSIGPRSKSYTLNPKRHTCHRGARGKNRQRRSFFAVSKLIWKPILPVCLAGAREVCCGSTFMYTMHVVVVLFVGFHQSASTQNVRFLRYLCISLDVSGFNTCMKTVLAKRTHILGQGKTFNSALGLPTSKP